jgi:hypothetical protein
MILSPSCHVRDRYRTAETAGSSFNNQGRRGPDYLGPSQRWLSTARVSSDRAARLLAPGCECTPGSQFHRAPLWTRNILMPKNAARQSSAAALRIPAPNGSHSSLLCNPLLAARSTSAGSRSTCARGRSSSDPLRFCFPSGLPTSATPHPVFASVAHTVFVCDTSG